MSDASQPQSPLEMFEMIRKLSGEVDRHKQTQDVLEAELQSEMSQLRAAVIREDQARVEEIRVRIHNVIDGLVDLKWSTSMAIKKIKQMM